MVRVRSWRRPGRLVPNQAHALRARCVVLKSGGLMAWHSTHAREELLLVMGGRVVLEWQAASQRIARRALAAGQCAWISAHRVHRVINAARQPAQYLYVTGPVHPHAARRTPHSNVHGSSSR